MHEQLTRTLRRSEDAVSITPESQAYTGEASSDCVKTPCKATSSIIYSPSASTTGFPASGES
jgi:hypothetical protein